jgi:peptidoglycan/xylan/chitin deacetylase (PgdA/CDA1 family)
MKRVFSAASALSSRLRPGPIILLYHRINSAARDSFRLNVSPAHFAEQLDVMSRRATVLRVGDLVAGHRRGRVPARSVAVTFDDAYVDNLLHAKPLLERAGATATIFATGSFHHEFWWDALERILFGPETLPPTLELEAGAAHYRWHLADLAVRRRRWLPIRVRVAGDRPAVHGLLRRLHSVLRSLGTEQRARALAELERWAGPANGSHTPYRSMTADELARAAESGVIDIGAHTLSHPRLALLAPAEQYVEIESSRRILQEVTGAPVSGFAYPFGQSGDYDGTTVQLLHDLGFDHACSAFPGRVLRRTDRYQLPRFWVEDWDGDEFERRLTRWLPG